MAHQCRYGLSITGRQKKILQLVFQKETLKLGLMNISTPLAFDTAEATPALRPKLDVQVVCSTVRDIVRRLSYLCRHSVAAGLQA